MPAGIQQSAARAAHRQSAEDAAGRHVQLRWPQERGPGQVLHRRKNARCSWVPRPRWPMSARMPSLPSVSPRPVYPDVKGQVPQNTIIGGGIAVGDELAALAAGVAKFFTFPRTDLQADWHQATGYLPITTGLMSRPRRRATTRRIRVPMCRCSRCGVMTTAKSRGVRPATCRRSARLWTRNWCFVWAGKKSAKDALDAAVTVQNSWSVSRRRSNISRFHQCFGCPG